MLCPQVTITKSLFSDVEVGTGWKTEVHRQQLPESLGSGQEGDHFFYRDLREIDFVGCAF